MAARSWCGFKLCSRQQVFISLRAMQWGLKEHEREQEEEKNVRMITSVRCIELWVEWQTVIVTGGLSDGLWSAAVPLCVLNETDIHCGDKSAAETSVKPFVWQQFVRLMPLIASLNKICHLVLDGGGAVSEVTVCLFTSDEVKLSLCSCYCWVYADQGCVSAHCCKVWLK